MTRKLMWVEWDDDAHLSSSRKKPGAYSPLTRDSDDNLGHVTLSEADDDGVSGTRDFQGDADGLDDWDQEDFEETVEAIVAVLTLIGAGVVWASPHVREWWSSSAKPALRERGRKLKVTLRRTPGFRRSANDAGVPIPAEASKSIPGSDVEEPGPEMSIAEAQRRFVQAVLAAGYANEQMRLLQTARITSDNDDPLELATSMRELTPERLQTAIHLLLQADPAMLDRTRMAELERALTEVEERPR